LQACFKIIKREILSRCYFFVLSDRMQTRGHIYKLYKQHASVNAYKFFSSNRVCDTWNALPSE